MGFRRHPPSFSLLALLLAQKPVPLPLIHYSPPGGIAEQFWEV